MFEELLSIIENLRRYLDHPDENRLLVLNDMGDAEDLICELVAAQSRTKIHRSFLQSKIIITVGNPRIFQHSNFKYFLYEMQPLPLAVVALGGLLSTKETVEERKTVNTSLGSKTQSNQALENILLLSYHDIPSDIKPCFLYFGLFPQHSEISTGILIRMWLSGGISLQVPHSSHEEKSCWRNEDCPSLVKLELYFSHLEKYDPTEKLGHLPLLKILHLWNSYKGTRWNCSSNMFLKLEELQISHLPNLVEWRIEAGAMPHLKRLSIFSCRKLSELPKGLRYINLQEIKSEAC